MAQKTSWLGVMIFSLVQQRRRLQCSKPAPGHQRENQHFKHPPHLVLPSSKERGHKGRRKKTYQKSITELSALLVRQAQFLLEKKNLAVLVPL